MSLVMLRITRQMLLALDTSTRVISLALHDGLAVMVESTWRTANHHTVELAPNTALILRRAGVEPGGLRGLAVALGPGSYTGLRIGLGLAKGLALAHNLPLFGVSTFEILMRAQPPRDERALAVLLAGRGRIAVAAYHWDMRRKEWELEGGWRVLSWETLAAEIREPTFVCGEVDTAGGEALRKLKGFVTLASPAQALRRAGYLAEIGWERLRRKQADNPANLAPFYGGQLEGSVHAGGGA
ncbi:MAG: tRNA (adenosine(37)-N6)-threonylcarbamoyltransferase complex dimerization subunit type 1 TsaB [Anaerolineales bacterium]